MHSVKLILTDAQMNKMKSSSPFQLSHRQLSGQSKGKHEVTLQLPEADSRRLVNNVQQGKGFRFNPKKFLRQAKNTLKKVGSAAKKARITANTYRLGKPATKTTASPPISNINDVPKSG